MSLSQTTVMKLYQSVIEDTINASREFFAEEGIDDQILLELRQSWESKVLASKAVDAPPPQELTQVPKTVPSTTVVKQTKSQYTPTIVNNTVHQLKMVQQQKIQQQQQQQQQQHQQQQHQQQHHQHQQQQQHHHQQQQQQQQMQQQQHQQQQSFHTMQTAAQQQRQQHVDYVMLLAAEERAAQSPSPVHYAVAAETAAAEIVIQPVAASAVVSPVVTVAVPPPNNRDHLSLPPRKRSKMILKSMESTAKKEAQCSRYSSVIHYANKASI